MLAEGETDKMTQEEEIIGSDSKAGISILRRRGSTRRTKHIERKVFFLQSYCQRSHVKIMKIPTEDMFSDSLTKVMTMPKHHVKKCGLNDVKTLLAACTVAGLGQAEGASSATERNFSDDGPTVWQVLALVLTLGVVIGFVCGWLFKTIVMKFSNTKKLEDPATEPDEQRAGVQGAFCDVYFAPTSGEHYHTRTGCGGLSKARTVKTLTACGTCKTRAG